MKDIAVIYENGKGRIAWDVAASGIDVLRQRVICCALTDRGTDTLAGKGTDFYADLFSTSSYDLQGMQHAVNFAVVEAMKQVREVPSSNAAEDTLASVDGAILSVNLDRKVEIGFAIKNLAGQRTVGSV